jgi:ankyrin repeat protein
LIDKPSRFLLASLHVDSLVSKKTTTKLKLALENLSHGSGALGDAYNKAIDRIDGQEHDDCTLAKQVLSWISYARRPLTTEELCHALAVETGDEDFDSENIPDVEDILSVCAGLVTVDQESQIVRLVHYTTQEYLESIRENWHPNAQQEIASTCLTYLCFEPFRSAPCPNHDEWESKCREYSFLYYSARYWPDHVFTVQEDICELAMALLQDSNLVSHAYVHGLEGYHKHLNQLTGLHLTASSGLLHLSGKLLSWAGKENMDLHNLKDSNGETPLVYAVKSGRKNVVELLLSAKAVDVNVKNKYGRTALIEALSRDHKEIVQLLLCTGKVDVSVSDWSGWTALTQAIKNGRKEMVDLLLNTGKFDVDAKIHGWTPVLLAAREGHKDIVELLLGPGKADVDKMPDRSALLRYAVGKGYKDLVEFLLGISTDASKLTDTWPLLALVAAERHRGIAELLGSGDIDLDAKGGDYNTTLLMDAAQRGRGDLVELLLNAGAEINARSHSGSTALMIAAEYGRKDMVELLLNAGADVHAKKNNGIMALMVAAAVRNEKGIVELLLDRGADVHAKDKDGSTALILAACSGRKETLELLLDRGADIHEKDKDGSTALILAARWNRREMLKLLLDRGADLHAKDKDGSTALIAAAEETSWDCKETLELLLDRGADIHARNKDGSTALIVAAASWNYKETVELLLDRGADVHAKNNDGSTALMLAEEEGLTYLAAHLRAHISRL